MPNPVLPSCRWCPALPPLDRRRIPGLAEARRKEPAVKGCGRGLAGVSALDRYGKASITGEAAHAQKWIFCVRPLTQSAQSSATQIRQGPDTNDNADLT